MMRECKRCGIIYDLTCKPIVLNINHRDIEALEDVMFFRLDEIQYKKIRRSLNRIWLQICDGEEAWKKKKVESKISVENFQKHRKRDRPNKKRRRHYGSNRI